MAIFRRRSTREDGPDPDDVTAGTGSAEVTDSELAVTPGDAAAGSAGAPDDRFDRAGGPFDAAEAESADQSLARLDLGSLLIPGLPGIGVQVEADPNTQEVRAVTGVGDQAAVQIQAFAAPRTEGLWDEIRAEMLAELAGTTGAQVAEGVGSFGPEIRGFLPARTPEGQQVRQAVRFVGIDGPRWFLRVVFLGRAALEPDPLDELHQLVLQTIVVRGSEAMAPRDPLPLTLPTASVSDEDDEPDEPDPEDPAPDGRYDLDPFERGPEITETR